jgi:YVTN family beta-propeller protein
MRKAPYTPEKVVTVLNARWAWVGLLAGCVLIVPGVAAQDAYVPNQGTDDVKIFDIRDPTDTVTLPTGDQPHEGVFTRDGKYVFVSNRLDHTVSVYDAVTRTELDTDGNAVNGTTPISVGIQPHGVAITPDNRHVFVTNDGSNDVSVIEVASLEVVSTVPGVGIAPHMVAISPDGKEAWVGNVGGGDVSIVDVELAIDDPSRAVVCVTPGGVGAECRISTGAGTEGVDFTHDGNGAVNSISVIDVSSRAVVDTLFVPGGPRRVHVRPDGLRAYVTQLVGNDVAVIDTDTHQLLAEELITDVPNGLGVSFRADGERIYVANFFSSQVTVIHVPDTEVREIVTTGANPDSVVVQPEEVFGLRFLDSTTLRWPRNFLADSYNVYRGDVLALPGGGSCLNAADPDTTDEVFVDVELPSRGQTFFYLVTIRHGSFEGIAGHATDGTLRAPENPCPAP